MLRDTLLEVVLLLSTVNLGLGNPVSDQRVISSSPNSLHSSARQHTIDSAISAAVEKYADPVAAYIALHPGAVDEVAEPRLLHIFGEEEPEWMTMGDKMRLRKKGKKYMDVTDYQDGYVRQVKSLAGKANLPELTHQRFIKPLFSEISIEKMHNALSHLTSFYNRYYGGVIGERSAQWLHDEIAKIISESPFHTHISLEFFTHIFPQPSIIARFEPKVRNFSNPLTILGAHQDSANYLFPLLPAPGADDDGSGTITILEAFRVLAHSGYIPQDGPVEFHWYAAEEAGNLGSQAVARYKKDSGASIGAMMEFDMTGYVSRNATESIVFIKTEADGPLTEWVLKLAREYISIDSNIYELPSGGGSDYMSYTKQNYPATFATEGNPSAHNGRRWGEYDPYLHTINDTMDVDDETGFFSIDHMAKFSELAIAFVIEQAGWDNRWR